MAKVGSKRKTNNQLKNHINLVIAAAIHGLHRVKELRIHQLLHKELGGQLL